MNTTFVPSTTKASPATSHVSFLTLWCVAFACVNLAVISVNTIALTVFYTNKKLLRKRPNHFIICLAATDLLVGLFVMPLYDYQLISWWHDPQRVLRDSLYDTFTALDILTGFASIFILVAIAAERFVAVSWPLYHRVAPKWLNPALIASVWVLSGVLVVFYFLSRAQRVPLATFVYLLISSISLSLFLICVLYAALWYRVKFAVVSRRRSSKRDKRLAVTLFIISVVFACTWLPFHVISFMFYFCKSPFCRPPSTLIHFSKLLHYSNSFINPIVYSFRNQEFRKTLKRLLNCCCESDPEITHRNKANYWERVRRTRQRPLERQPAFGHKRRAENITQL